MKLDCRTLVYLIVVIIIAFLIFVPLIQSVRSTHEGYLQGDYFDVNNGYIFQENVVKNDQTQAFGCGC